MSTRASRHRNAVLVGVLAACLLFLCLILAARLPTLIAFILALFGGGAVLAAVISIRPPAQSDDRASVLADTPAEPPPVQFQALTVTGVRLPSAHADYAFAFTANVLWLPAGEGVNGTSEVARHEIIRRAREITERRDPSHVSLIAPDLAVALGVLRSDPGGQVHARAESVQLRLPPEDQQRLDELAELRKQDELWDYQRRAQVSKRQYLHTDVLKDSGSAVVWWLAKHEDNPDQVAEKISVLSQLARVANNETDAGNERLGEPSAPLNPAEPLRPAEQFDAFLDSLDPRLSDDARLLLTDQVARFVYGHDPKAADEMRRRRDRPSDSDHPNSFFWDDPGIPHEQGPGY
jgi:hypothetical protein